MLECSGKGTGMRRCLFARSYTYRVLRAEDGSSVLLDFGAARQAIGAKSRSVPSIVTPGYAPIERYSYLSSGNFAMA